MSTINELARFVSQATFATLPSETRDYVKMHILDTVGAMLAGPQTIEGLAIGKLISRFAADGNVSVIGYPIRTGLLPAIIAEVSAARCTEMDDYHKESSVTPGSVIVPTALSLVSSGYLADPQDFVAAVTIGYEMFIRLGISIDGPKVLYKGIWPTYLGAVLGSAAVTAKALRLNSQQTASALATALALSAGIRISLPKGVSSRCLTLGISAQNGVIAAFSAQEGFTGDINLLDKGFGQAHGILVENEKLVGGLGQNFRVEQTGIKPFPVAGQALSALEAFRQIITTNSIAPESIQEISVWVPKAFVAMIDRPNFPETQIESVLSVQYQIALMAFYPEALLDVRRDRLIKDDQIGGLIKKIYVKPSEDLIQSYPSTSPARVEIKTAKKSFTLVIVYPKGHPNNRFNWQEVIDKFRWVTKPVIEEEKANQLAHLIRTLDDGMNLTRLIESLTGLHV
jgi:2-methylcitrate dehydratase PrpD